MADHKDKTEKLHVMLGDDFKVDDYVYIISKTSLAIDRKSSPYIKKKLSTQDIINLKLGIPFKLVCPNYLIKLIYKIIKITKYHYEVLKYDY